ncbi:hypothetical protein ACFWA0_12385, partial [Streptomyces xanthophaeus]
MSENGPRTDPRTTARPGPPPARRGVLAAGAGAGALALLGVPAPAAAARSAPATAPATAPPDGSATPADLAPYASYW